MGKHCLIFCVLCIGMQTALAQLSPEGLVLYLPFNGDTKDYSGNNYNADNYGAVPTAGFNGQPNTAYFFNGRSAVVIPDIQKLDGQLSEFSVLVRYKPSLSRNGADYNFFSWQRNEGDDNQSFLDGKLRIGWMPLSFRPNYDYLAFTANWCTGSNSTFNGWEVDTGSADNQWQTMGIVYSHGTIRTFFDCRLMREWPSEFPAVSDLCGASPMEILIGSVLPRAGGDARNFVGIIDEVRIYNRALANSEVEYFGDSACKQITPPQPLFNYSVNPCQPNQLTFTDSSVVNATTILDKKIWTVNGTDSSNGDKFDYTFSHTGDYTVRLSLYTGGLGYYRDSVIHIASVDTRRFLKTSKQTVYTCAGSATQLNVPGGTAYTWAPWDNLSDCHTASPIAKPASDMVYTVVANDSTNTCKDTAHIEIKIVASDNSVYVPTAFTPNGDGKNDSWGVASISPLDGFNLQVFNRWGMNVFASQNQGLKWSGAFNGKPSPPGTYIWALRYKNGSGCPQKQANGTVVLIR